MRFKLSLFLTFLYSIIFLGIFLISGKLLFLFAISFGITIMLVTIFMNKDYSISLYYLGFLGIIIFQGLILTYIYLFLPFYRTNLLFYGMFGIFIIYILYFAYYYPRRYKYRKIPW
ncbi:hypothetical protein J2743_001061 [Methanobacterium petrolearium]|nr:hypothetical protein [Methanobacterium petrolearium]